MKRIHQFTIISVLVLTGMLPAFVRRVQGRRCRQSDRVAFGGRNNDADAGADGRYAETGNGDAFCRSPGEKPDILCDRR